MAFLEIAGLTKKFGETVAVRNAQIQIEEGSFFTFLGPSGCGKTTTLRMVAGFEEPTEGTVIMDGKNITDLPPERRQIGMMFQNYALFPHMTVHENVAYGPRIKKKPRAEIQSLVEHYLELVGLSGYGARKITQLSGGEQQRVALARSLAIEPKILLLDEPLSNLDAKMRDEMRFELKRLQHELKITMLYVTHDQSEALMMSDRIAVFYKGEIQQIGDPEEIYASPANSFVANFVGQTNLIDLNASGQAKDFLFELMHPGTRFASIRNEYISLCQEAGNDAERLYIPAKVTQRQFNGMTSYYTIEAMGETLSITAMNDGNGQGFAAGQDVYASIGKRNIAMLEA